MSEPAPTLPYGAGPPPESEGSDLIRFIAVILAGAIMIGAAALLIIQGQNNNSQKNYEACLERVEGNDSLPGSRPQDFCQQPK